MPLPYQPTRFVRRWETASDRRCRHFWPGAWTGNAPIQAIPLPDWTKGSINPSQMVRPMDYRTLASNAQASAAGAGQWQAAPDTVIDNHSAAPGATALDAVSMAAR